jgi:tetratricopeptide (TPR) repeat protein
MYTFLAICTDATGRDIVERVRASDIKHARDLLEERGFTDIVFEYDSEIHGEPKARTLENPPELELEIRRTGRIPWRVWLKTWGWNLAPFLAWNAWSWWDGPPFGRLDRVGFWLSGGVVATAFLLGLPMHLYHCLLAASAWHRWDRVLRLAPLMRVIGVLIRSRHLQVDARFRNARALVGRGKVNEAFALVDDLRSPANELGRLADIYWAAGAREDALALKRQAAEALPDKADGWIDYAEILLRAGEFEGARAAIERARPCELHAMALTFVSFVDGVLALEGGEAEQAVEKLGSAIEQMGAHSDPVAEACQLYWTAFLVLALVEAGQRDAARERLESCQLYLRATEKHELLERCQRAVR